jgi:hypothetical protein
MHCHGCHTTGVAHVAGESAQLCSSPLLFAPSRARAPMYRTCSRCFRRARILPTASARAHSRHFAGMTDFELLGEGGFQIDAYGPTAFQVGNRQYTGPLLMYHGVVLSWRVTTWKDITPDAYVQRPPSHTLPRGGTHTAHRLDAGCRHCCCLRSGQSCSCSAVALAYIELPVR